jgi:hypothetical protein
MDRLGNQVHAMIQTLTTMKFSKATVAIVQPWFEEHKGELQHLPWTAQKF